VWNVPLGTKLTDAQYESYKAGNLYFNIHSAANKAGEIRGSRQSAVAPESLFSILPPES
jgi:hypothetical protein